MVDDILVHHAQLSARGGAPFYLLSIEHQKHEGFVGVRGHIIPADTFETRAAEYDIDPDSETGWDDILNITLFYRTQRQSVADQLNHPDHLFNAPTVAQAREAALQRVRDHLGGRKLRGVVGPPAGRLLMANAVALDEATDSDDPLEFVKRTAPMSAEHMFVKREFTRRRRNLLQAKRVKQGALRLRDLAEVDEQAEQELPFMPSRPSSEILARQLLGEAPATWTYTGDEPEEKKTRRSAVYRDENDEIRSRLPPREGTPSKYA